MYLYLNIHSFGDRLLQAFSWMLVHSLWQGMLLALLAVIFLQLSSRVASAVRYNILLTHFIVFVVACIVTFFRELTGSVTERAVPLADSIGHGASTLFRLDAVNVKAFAASSAAYISANAHLLVILWALFFAFRSFRMIQGMIYLRNARQQRVYAAAEEWRERLQQCCHALGVTRTVRLLESAYVKVPVVAGHLKPVILMPVGLLTGLPAQQIEAVLLHELAHIRRHDYIVNLQVCCETVFFFNPGLLWMSVLLRDEREHCCDDIALQQTGSKKTFIEALISFKEYTLSARYPAVAFPGRKNQLLQRVSRIINNRHQSLGTAEKIGFFIGMAMLSVVLSTAAITQLGRHTSMKINTPYRLAKGEDIIAAPVITAQDTVVPAPAPAVVVTRQEPVINVVHYKPTEKRTSEASAQAGAETSPVPDIDEEQMAAPAPEARAQQDMMEAARQQKEQLRLQWEQAEKDRHRATLDKLQAEQDRKQATLDRIQADKDRERARLDRIQADKDRVQADRDRAQADKDRQQAIIDRVNADQERAAHEVAAAKHAAERKALFTNNYNGNYNTNRYKDKVQ